ncbi:MAG TPA: S8 family serine peptidase [Rhizomicrobium sp.]|nr:S8 family serine peptidase [Rhizomicrobium sp.]
MLRNLAYAAIVAAFAAIPAAQAGTLGLPVGVSPIALPRTAIVPGILNSATGTLDSTFGIVRDTVGRPQRMVSFDRDTNGARVLRQTVLALSPTGQSLSIAEGLNFQIVRQQNIASLGLSVVQLRAPDGLNAVEALSRLRRADPAGTYDYDHIYNPSGGTQAIAAIAPVMPPAQTNTKIRIGMIDGGVDRRHSDFASATIIAKNFASDQNIVPTAHGTAVASLLVGKTVQGTIPSANLYAADVYGGEASGGAADGIARALGWLAENNVPVANISLVGPPNIILQAAVDAFLRRGHIIAAAAGNDGPAAPPEYPAAYEGVAAITSVDENHAVQFDAGRGPHIAFAGLGVGRRVAAMRGGHATVTGTSYAAPEIAVRFAIMLAQPNPAEAKAVWATLEHEAVDLGAPGRDPIFGYGFLSPLGAPDVIAAQ